MITDTLIDIRQVLETSMKSIRFPVRFIYYSILISTVFVYLYVPVVNADEHTGESWRLPYMSEVIDTLPVSEGHDHIELRGVDCTDCTDCNDEVMISDNENAELNWDFEITVAGRYQISLSYDFIDESGSNAVRNIKIDGDYPFFEANNIVLYRKWTDSGDKRVNSIGDEVRPGTEEYKQRHYTPLKDGYGYYPTPLIFFFEKGIIC